jgi:hypothetical protein
LWDDCLENVGSSTSHNPMGLHDLLQCIVSSGARTHTESCGHLSFLLFFLIFLSSLLGGIWGKGFRRSPSYLLSFPPSFSLSHSHFSPGAGRRDFSPEVKDAKKYCFSRLLTDFEGNTSRGRTIESYGTGTHLKAEEMVTVKCQHLIRYLPLSHYLHRNVSVTDFQ